MSNTAVRCIRWRWEVVCDMKIVLMQSPKLLAPILRKVFGVEKKGK